MGEGGPLAVDEELVCVKNTSSVSRITSLCSVGCHLPLLGKAKDSCHICGGRAITASGEFFDEPIGSAGGIPQGGYHKPPARLVVMTGQNSLKKRLFEKRKY